MSTFVELEKQVQKNAVLERRIADLEVLNAQLDRRNRQLAELLSLASAEDPATTAYHAEMQRLRAEREAV